MDRTTIDSPNTPAVKIGILIATSFTRQVRKPFVSDKDALNTSFLIRWAITDALELLRLRYFHNLMSWQAAF